MGKWLAGVCGEEDVCLLTKYEKCVVLRVVSLLLRPCVLAISELSNQTKLKI